jgi:hypothetical protein
MLTNRLVGNLLRSDSETLASARRASQAFISPFSTAELRQCFSRDSHPLLRHSQTFNDRCPAILFLPHTTRRQAGRRVAARKFSKSLVPHHFVIRPEAEVMHSTKKTETRQITPCRAPLELPDNAKPTHASGSLIPVQYPYPCIATSPLYSRHLSHRVIPCHAHL